MLKILYRSTLLKLSRLVSGSFLLAVLTSCGVPLPKPSAPVSLAPPKPYPTMDTRRWMNGTGQTSTLTLPNALLNIDISVHPTEDWPVIAATDWGGVTDEPRHAFVRVLNPETGTWGKALQMDIGQSNLGANRFARTVVAVQGNHAITAVWGSSDAPNRDVAGIWTSSSTDYGANWSAPTKLTQECYEPLDLAATVDGQFVLLLNCRNGETVYPALMTRRADGTWLPRQRVDAPAWYDAQGAIVIRGAGADARAVALLSGARPSMGEGTVYIAAKYLVNERDGWEVTKRTAQVDGQSVPDRFWHVQGIAFDRIAPQVPARQREGMVFTWTDRDAGHVYSITSLDAGLSWGEVESVASFAENDPTRTAFAAPAYDPLADRLVTIWTCCNAAQYDPKPTTHYASWSVPGSGTWLPKANGPLTPLAFDSRAAYTTAIAQTANSRIGWIAWVDAQRTLNVRSFDLNQIIPVDQYPVPTPVPTPVGG